MLPIWDDVYDDKQSHHGGSRWNEYINPPRVGPGITRALTTASVNIVSIVTSPLRTIVQLVAIYL